MLLPLLHSISRSYPFIKGRRGLAGDRSPYQIIKAK